MAQDIKLQATGLFTNPSDLTRPEGALTVADNVVVRRPNIIEPRRGVEAYSTYAADAIWPYASGLVTFKDDGNKIGYISAPGSVTENTGTYDVLSRNAALAGNNFYFLTQLGPYKKDTLTGTPKRVGTPKCYGLENLGSDYFKVTAAIGDMSLTSNVVTVDLGLGNDHGFYVGQLISQTSVTEAPYAKGNYIVASVPNSYTFTYALTAGNDAGNANAHTFKPTQLELTNGWLADGYQAAYRVLFNMPDANETERPGAASSRFIIANTSDFTGYVATTKANPVIRVFVPPDLTNESTVRVYRSRSVEVAVEPSDEMGLVFERLVTPIEIAQGWLEIVDVCPDIGRGETLYVSPSQEGIEQNNDRPPIAYSDIVHDGQRLLFADTEGVHRLEISLLSVNKLVAGGTFVVQWLGGDVELFAVTTVSAASHFKIYTSGSDAQNIRNTALDLCATFNRFAYIQNSTIRAYYASSATDNPGRIVFEQTVLNAEQFECTTDQVEMRDAFYPRLNAYATAGITTLSRTGSTVTATVTHYFRVGEQVTLENFTGPGTAFGPGPHTILTTTATTFTYTETGSTTSITPTAGAFYSQTNKIQSSSDAVVNRVYESKPYEFEAVPLLNYADIGERNKPILKLAVMRNTVFAFKEDGIFIRTAPLTWELFDPTVKLIAPQSVVTLQNQIYALTSQGVVGVTDTGVEILSKPIEDKLLALQKLNFTSLKQLSYGVSYESEHTYELRCITATGDTYATQGFIWNALDRTWVRDTLQAKHAVVNSADDKRYMAGATQIVVERKTGGNADFQDVSGPVQTADFGVGDNYAWFSVDPNFSPGDTVVTDLGTTHVVDEVGLDTYYEVYFTTADVPPSATTFAISNPFTSTIEFAPVTAGDAGILKNFRQVNVLFQNAHAEEMKASFWTELRALQTVTAELEALTGQFTSTWDGIDRPYNLSLLVPQEVRRGTRLAIQLQFEKPNGAWKINGLVLRLAGGGDKVSR
jgi:hypothetical protein